MLIVVKGIDDYMLPCLNKKILGFECMGCGIQRSIALIFEGKLVDAFFMYPAIYTLLTLFAFVLINLKIKFKQSKKIISSLAYLNLTIIIINYLIKINL